ncbi:hypothetical protein ACFQZS_03305 [Mucilaginibacter calamicampi]|uniref:Uncharacterized protein n=1 Tax=Mucilaginibacter calamicampi TaxID=1302352 RepID=A0ABW2YRX4_9SPHI
MKKPLPVLLLLAACRFPNYGGTYSAHVENPYQQVRQNQLPLKQYKVRQWGLLSPDAPELLFRDHQLVPGQTIYQQVS